MKRQINIGLFLLFLFIVWLFFNTWSVFSYKNAKLKQDKNSNYRYAISTTGDPSPIILDRGTGGAWRFFRTWDKGHNEIIEEGWIQMSYTTALGSRGITPEIANKNEKRRLDEIVNKVFDKATKN